MYTLDGRALVLYGMDGNSERLYDVCLCVCVRESKRDSCMRMSIVCVCVSLSSVFEYVCCQRQRSLTIFYERAASRGSRMNKPFLFYVFQEIGTQKIYALFLSGICVLDVCVCV